MKKNLSLPEKKEEPLPQISEKNREILQQFIASLEFQQKKSIRTLETYEQILVQVFAYLEKASPQQIAATTELDLTRIKKFLRDRGPKVQAATQALWVSAIRSFLKWYLQERGNKDSQSIALVLREIMRPKVPVKIVKIFNEEDLILLLKHLESRPIEEQFLFELLYGMGLRISEALNLKKGDFKLNENLLEVRGKGSKIRTVPLTPNIPKILHQISDPLWGPLINARSLRQWVSNWGKSIPLGDDGNLHLHPHKLRHSIASHLLRRGVSLPQIQKLLGHKKLSTTQRYTHLRTEDILAAYDAFFPKKVGSG
jgi:site-specific recombinase XerD